MKGEWILVNPTDCFSIQPIYECSKCKQNSFGYLLESVCENCGSFNKVNPKKCIDKAIFEEAEEK